MVFATLVGVNVYIFFLRGGTSIGALVRTTHMKGGPSPTLAVPASKKPAAPKIVLTEDPVGGHARDVVLTDGQTLAQALAPITGKRQASQLEAALGDELDLASVRAGEVMTLVYDEDERLTALELRVSPTSAYRLDIGARKTTASRIDGKYEVRTVGLALPAGPSLADALRRSNETPALAERLGALFLGDDVLTNAPSAERLRVVVEKRYVAGKFQRYGRILGADWVSRSGLRRAFAFGDAAYTEHGESVARRYLVSPLRPGKSNGQRRVVPGMTEGRYAVEHACGKDSVIHAVASGTVTAITRGKDGASVTLEVADGERVVYSHVLRPSRLVSLGDEVEQGRALGRTDGSVTLEYDGEAARIARAYEESHVPAPRIALLPGADRPRFGEAVAPILERLRELAIHAADPLAMRSYGAIP